MQNISLPIMPGINLPYECEIDAFQPSLDTESSKIVTILYYTKI
jgi:hypothetical protein